MSTQKITARNSKTLEVFLQCHKKTRPPLARNFKVTYMKFKKQTGKVM